MTPSEISLDGATHRLDRRIRTVWAVARALPIGLIGGTVVLAVGLNGSAAAAAVWGAITGIGVAAAIASAFWSWRGWGWAAWDDALELHHGIVFRAESVVPYHRIQQIDIHRGPLERFLSLSTLILRTASSTTDARVKGLAARHAEVLRHELLERTGVDDAV